MQESKRIKSAKYVSHFETCFACPICHSSMKVVESKNLICTQCHTFDFAKQGYLNLLTRSVKAKYSKELFEARRKLMTESDFFDPLIQQIAKLINDHVVKAQEPMSILDMGCGDGSHLVRICGSLSSHFNQKSVGVGMDLSKEGIMVAAKNDSNNIWIVADLANAPFKHSQFNVILNILSPSNYAEFNRLLKNKGLVIKVVPQSGYLKELREYHFDESKKQHYSNAETVKRFQENHLFVDRSRLSYTVNLDKAGMRLLVQMTPLTWTMTKERLASFLNQDSTPITVDVDILIGKQSL